jgi:hypothetical protein
MGEHFTTALKQHSGVIAGNVTGNIFERHLKPVFID